VPRGVSAGDDRVVVRISVIVPVRDDPRIDGLLASLASQDGAPPFEVLVALDGARREPLVSPSLSARLLRLPPRGPYPARNAAVREAKGEILLFTDSDCLCPPDWIATAARFFEDETAVAIQGASRAGDDSRLSRLIQLEYDRYVASHAALGYRRFCNTRNFAIRAAIARELPLPEALPRGGDGVYGGLLEKRGLAIRYEPGWWVTHRHPASRWDEGWCAFEQGKNGAFWAGKLDLDLFASVRGRAPRGPGTWLLSRSRSRPAAQRAASLALLPVAAFFAAMSVVLRGDAGAGAFNRFRRASHLAGRLYGLATKPEPDSRPRVAGGRARRS
jgi:glycosyltransferase involved in cell wall biosynthesis